jgi:hypothetical protein
MELRAGRADEETTQLEASPEPANTFSRHVEEVYAAHFDGGTSGLNAEQPTGPVFGQSSSWRMMASIDM